jgi:hypothetical protein
LKRAGERISDSLGEFWRRNIMRKVFLFLLIVVSYSFIFPQEIIENPEKPLGKNSGRVVKLKEMMQISDVGDKFYFKYPRSLKVTPDGFIFIKDVEQFLQFAPDGRFVQNLFKKGQGPGEMQSIGNCFFNGENIIVHELWTDKILWFDFKGKPIKEFKINANLSIFLLFWNDTYYFLSSDRPFVEKTSIVDINQKLVSVAQEGKEIKEITSFPTKGYIAIGTRGGRVFYEISSVIAVPFMKKFLFVSHTQEYLVKLYNVEKNQVIRSFKRKYKRVKTPRDVERKGGASLDGKPVLPPRQKYLNDIQNLLIFKDRLWVVTSTKDKEKRVLIDVYNSEGKYIDNFYLKFPENLVQRYHGYTAMDISGDCLYTIEESEDGIYSIRKYKIEDNDW